MSSGVWRILAGLGPLRLGMAAMAVALVLLMPPPGSEVVLQGWQAVVTAVVPALAPILTMVYFLDVLMALVFRKDQPTAERRRYAWIIFTDLFFAALLLMSWLPIMLALRR